MSSNFELSKIKTSSSFIDQALLGKIAVRTDIPSLMGPFTLFPDYKVKYPEIIIRVLGEIYQEYNQIFASLVKLNKEWGMDYQFTKLNNGSVNWMVQIDMAGLPQEFLQNAHTLTETEAKLYLRKQIFEIENSLAMYSLSQEVFSNGAASQFKKGFKKSLDELRTRYNRPIALLAVTEEKYEAMRATEFGKTMDDPLSDEEVKNMSGFDRFFGPGGFIKHLRSNGGQCQYLLYVRCSDPTRKLKKPDEVVEHPLLDNPEIRRVIKECSVTVNIDSPKWNGNDPRRVNDTKLYMPAMNMGYSVLDESFLWNKEFNDFISIPRKRYRDFVGERLSEDFINFLASLGVNYQDVENGLCMLRAKPALATYGCYGHLRGCLNDAEFRKELRRLMRKRSGYIIQPEMNVHQSCDSETGMQYAYIDRNFFSITSGAPVFIGGIRNFTPTTSAEAVSGRGHAHSTTIFAEIIA